MKDELSIGFSFSGHLAQIDKFLSLRGRVGFRRRAFQFACLSQVKLPSVKMDAPLLSGIHPELVIALMG